MSFEFSESTLNRLIECVGYMKLRDEESLASVEHLEQSSNSERGWTKIIIGAGQIGQTCTLSTMMQLIEVANKRVDLDVNLIDWESLISKHIHSREETRQNPWTFGIGSKERCVLYHAIKFRQYFLVRALLEAGVSPNGTVKQFLFCI